MNKNKLIPELRFPEFKNDGEWVEMQLGDSLLRNPEYGINAPAVLFSNKLPTYLRITDISDDGRFLSNEKVSVARVVTEDNYLSDGDIVLARTGANVGKSYKYRSEDGRLVFAGFLIRLKPDSNKLNSDFLFQFLATNQYWKWVSFISARSGQPGINATEYSSLPVCLPKPKEQQKIASCLSSLDEVIAAHSQKLELLKDHKKGLMQNLFPQEGEKVPMLRFKEFENIGEWVEKSLDKVVNEFIVPMRDKPKKLDGDIPWCRIEDFNGIYLSESKSSQGVSLETVKEMNLKIYPTNTLLVSCSADLGKCAITQKPLITNQTFIGLVIDDKKINSLFLYYIMTNLRKELNARSSGTTISYLSRQQFEQFEILIPPNEDKKEQEKIASCLFSLDSLITAQTEKIEHLKLHKKGLMQSLFPKINE